MKFPFLRLVVLAVACPVVVLHAQTASPVQSPARPFNLDIVGKVQLAASDDASAAFQKEQLPDIITLIDKNLAERNRFTSAASFNLDPTKLRMAVESTARVYFVAEGAGYRNTLGFNTLTDGEATPKASLTENAQIIFPDATSGVAYLDPKASQLRTKDMPLIPGDFVDLGKFEAGSTLDFFLIANGASGGRDIWTAPASRNSDGLDHVVAFALPDSPYLIIAFEDLRGGGDKDYNDVIFAVDIGAVNVQRLLSTPEPAAWATFGVVGAIAFVARRRMKAPAVPSIA